MHISQFLTGPLGQRLLLTRTCRLPPWGILSLHLAGELVEPLARHPLAPVLPSLDGVGVCELAGPRLHVPWVLLGGLSRHSRVVLRGLSRAGILRPLSLHKSFH